MSAEHRSLLSVLETVASCGEVSRAQLSNMTGFSQVTVGKAVDTLDAVGVLTQYKQERGSVGRKSGICRLNNNLGMLLFEIEENRTRVRICGISLDIKEEINASVSFCDSFIPGFSKFTEHFGDGMLGIGCVVQDGMTDKYLPMVKAVLGQPPEVIIEKSRAFAAANAFRLDADGFALYLRMHADRCFSGSLLYNGKLFYGAHGCAGAFTHMSLTSDCIGDKLADVCSILDPALIHIACEDENMCDDIMGIVSDKLISACTCDTMPSVIVEPIISCRDELEGAARLIREKYVLAKFGK